MIEQLSTSLPPWALVALMITCLTAIVIIVALVLAKLIDRNGKGKEPDPAGIPTRARDIADAFGYRIEVAPKSQPSFEDQLREIGIGIENTRRKILDG